MGQCWAFKLSCLCLAGLVGYLIQPSCRKEVETVPSDAWSAEAGQEGGPSTGSLATSCSGRTEERWRSGVPAEEVASWLKSMVSVGGPGEVQAATYQRSAGSFDPWYSGTDRYMLADLDNEFYDNDNLLTIGRFRNGKPVGLAWQRRSNAARDGWLYGPVDRAGRFTGPDITFLYPGLRRGLRGSWKDGKLVKARGVEVSGARCQAGLLELAFTEVGARVEWTDADREDWVGPHPTVMDPGEEDSVYVARSGRANSTALVEGLFARRSFLPGELVSYFSGVKTTEEKMLGPGPLTDEQDEELKAYYYGFGGEAPSSWEYSTDLVIDIPIRYRSVAAFTTTVGHKVNHRFTGTNVEFGSALHPVFGGVVCVIAETAIEPGQELFVSYGYHSSSESYEDFIKNIDQFSPWYREEFSKVPEDEARAIFDDQDDEDGDEEDEDKEDEEEEDEDWEDKYEEDEDEEDEDEEDEVEEDEDHWSWTR